jgi:hypothetical protein
MLTQSKPSSSTNVSRSITLWKTCPPTSGSYNPGGRGHWDGMFWGVTYRIDSKNETFMVLFLLYGSEPFVVYEV